MNSTKVKPDKTSPAASGCKPVLFPMVADTCEGGESFRLPDLNQSFIIGSVPTPAGNVPRVAAALTAADRRGTFKARWGVGRMNYTVQSGLYALGAPDEKCPVLVTANYKMSFDRLRRELSGRNAWILVLDTKGINVWCAAGKGTFSTAELLKQIETSGLSRVVAHKTLIVPQLGAPGLAAHHVRKHSGFKVVYGPVRAEDLPEFLDKELKATAAMRKKTFPLRERVVLIPVELVDACKYAFLIFLAFFLLGGLSADGSFWSGAVRHGLPAAYGLFAAVLSGAVLTPLLLPWLPGKAFSLKGLWPGLVAAAILIGLYGHAATSLAARLEILAWVVLIPATAAYLAMNFTGASTYTSRSGVKKEMRRALPMQIAGGLMGIGLWLGARFFV